MEKLLLTTQSVPDAAIMTGKFMRRHEDKLRNATLLDNEILQQYYLSYIGSKNLKIILTAQHQNLKEITQIV